MRAEGEEKGGGDLLPLFAFAFSVKMWGGKRGKGGKMTISSFSPSLPSGL